MECNDIIDVDELTKSFMLLKNAYFVEHEDLKQLESLIQNYKEEVRISRECENSERMRATSCQQYVAHEQEIVRQLIAVRGENTKLVENIAKLEENIAVMKQDLAGQQRKHEQDVMKAQEQHKVELVCLNKKHDVEIREKQAQWDKLEAEWNKNRAELLTNIEALQKKLDASVETASIAASLFEEKIGNLETKNSDLRKELQDMRENTAMMRDRASANINLWKKKSLEQQERLQKLERPAPTRQPTTPRPYEPPPSILKRGKSVKFYRNAMPGSSNGFSGANAQGSGEQDRACMPTPSSWGTPPQQQHPTGLSEPSAHNSAAPNSNYSTQTPKKRKLFSINSAMNEDLYNTDFEERSGESLE